MGSTTTGQTAGHDPLLIIARPDPSPTLLCCLAEEHRTAASRVPGPRAGPGALPGRDGGPERPAPRRRLTAPGGPRRWRRAHLMIGRGPLRSFRLITELITDCP